MLLYLFMHIVETSTVLLGPDVYDTTLGFFRNPVIRAGEILLMAALVYHSLNGLKIILIDFVPAATREEMEKRTDWGTLLTPQVPDLPTPQDVGPLVRPPDW